MKTWPAHRLPLIVVAVLLATRTLYAGDVAFDASSAQSGPWSRPETWAYGRTPRTGDRVPIRPGDTVLSFPWGLPVESWSNSSALDSSFGKSGIGQS
jgi:hypothetical protein